MDDKNDEIYEDDFISGDTMTAAVDIIIEEPPKDEFKNRGTTNIQVPSFRRIDSLPLHTESPVRSMTNMVSDINGWNQAASKTVSNWLKLFREYSFVYQYVLDANQKMASRLNMISTISSSTLGIFSAFKLWMNDQQTFSTTSDIILMIFNFGIAILTNASKRYLDDSRNEKIRIYIEEIDKFVGELLAQVLKMPEYRMKADEFIKKQNDVYTKLITQQPSLSIDELEEGKNLYKKLKKHRIELNMEPNICS